MHRMNRQGNSAVATNYLYARIGKERGRARFGLRAIDVGLLAGAGFAIVGEQMQVDGEVVFAVDDALWQSAL